MKIPSIPPGLRNVVLIESFFIWTIVALLIFEPPDGVWGSELINAVSLFLLTNGATLVGAICGRALNKHVERKGDAG